MDSAETNRCSVTCEAVTVEKLVYGGAGLARLEGRVALVPFVLPGETVRLEVLRERSGFVEARALEVVSPAPGRVQAPCPFYSRCGGCQYQHVGYEAQLELKREILRDTCRRLGKLELGEVAIVAGPPWGYRNRTQFHIEQGRIGYFEVGSHRLCPIDRCPISSPKINETLGVLIDMLRSRRFPKFVRSIELFTNESEVQLNVLASEGGQAVARRFFDWAAERIQGARAGTLDYREAGEVYRVGHRSFFQVNRFLAGELVRRALEGAEGETAFDLYAGVGLFSLPLARRFRRVAAVESNGWAVRDLEFNAARAGLAVEVRKLQVDLFLESAPARPDFVLADPPRSGLGRRVVGSLLRLRPPRLVLVSCDPATLARDLAQLTAGGYRIEQLSLVDLFPQTYHIETIAALHLGQ